VNAESVTWLWPGRIPLGKLTLIFGDPEAGKSFVSLDLAARVTRGAAFPDGTSAVEGSVVLLANEDGLADTIRPRMDTLYGAADRVLVLEGVRDTEGARILSLEQDLHVLEHTIQSEHGTRLVVIDPLSTYIGRRTDTWRDNQVRAVLEPLAELAARTGVAMVGLMHMTKDEQRRALARIVGSGAFGQVARAAYLVAQEPESGRRLFACAKFSIGPKPQALAFTIRDLGNYRADIEWDATPLDLDAQQVLARMHDTREDVSDAEKFLRAYLALGPKLVEDVLAAGVKNGFSNDVLKRAKKKLKIESDKLGVRNGSWTWRLPEHQRAAA
jgi:RecA-family ATPase